MISSSNSFSNILAASSLFIKSPSSIPSNNKIFTPKEITIGIYSIKKKILKKKKIVSWLPFWLITLQHHGICSYTARSRVLYRSGCDWCTTTLSRLSQTPSYFPRAWGHSLNTCQQSSAFGPECVKTLSHLVCPSPLRLGVVFSRAFATIRAGGAAERL